MTTHISEKELKKPDAFLEKGREAVMSFEKYHNAIYSIIGILAVVFGGVAIITNQMEKKEIGLQTQYYKIEKSYLKKKEDIEKQKADKETAQNETKNQANDKDKSKNKTADLAKDKKDQPEVDTLEKYKDELTQFQELIQKEPGSQAAAMAALVVSDIYSDKKDFENAKKALETVYPQQKKTAVVRALVGHALGTIQANLGKCDDALKTWEPLTHEKTFDFLTDELKLKMAICDDQMGQSQKAEELLVSLKSKAESQQGKTAEKYLRYLKYKKQGS